MKTAVLLEADKSWWAAEYLVQSFFFFFCEYSVLAKDFVPVLVKINIDGQGYAQQVFDCTFFF